MSKKNIHRIACAQRLFLQRGGRIIVTPAQAGVQEIMNRFRIKIFWIPACAGMTSHLVRRIFQPSAKCISRTNAVLWTIAALIAAPAWHAANAQPDAAGAFPVRPVRLIVPYPPGGGSDVIARILAPRMTEGFGQQVVIDNGAGRQPASIAHVQGGKLKSRTRPHRAPHVFVDDFLQGLRVLVDGGKCFFDVRRAEDLLAHGESLIVQLAGHDVLLVELVYTLALCRKKAA